MLVVIDLISLLFLNIKPMVSKCLLKGHFSYWRNFVIYFKSMTKKINNVKYYLLNHYISFFSCTSKYVGEYCQYLNPCHTGPGPRCQNGGSCQVRVSPGSSPSFTCSCPLGFSASLCEIRIANSCDQRPCLNGGTCFLRSLEAYQCSCAQGYTGKRNLSFF